MRVGNSSQGTKMVPEMTIKINRSIRNTYVYVSVCMHIYIQIYIFIYTHIYIYIQIAVYSYCLTLVF